MKFCSKKQMFKRRWSDKAIQVVGSVCWLTGAALFAWGLSGCKLTQRQEMDGDAEARLIVSFPQTQACFDDERIETFEQLRQCIELVTHHKVSIAADGSVVELGEEVGEGLLPPANVE